VSQGSLSNKTRSAAKYARVNGVEAPILHLPQLIGLALGIDPKELRVDRHVISTRKVWRGSRQLQVTSKA